MKDRPLIPHVGTAANPKRRFKKKTYVIDGQPILRVLGDGERNHNIRDGVSVASVHFAADGIRRCKSGVAMFRMCGLIFDMPHITFPTVDQQFRALEHYAANCEHLLFDGWRDVIVQRLNPQVMHNSISQKPCIEECFKHQHFTHIATSSLAFTKERSAISLLMCGLAVRGKTFAALDLGIDTLAYPDQLIGAAPVVATTEALLIGRLSRLMEGDQRRLGWEKVVGRYVPNNGMRAFLRNFVKIVDRRFALSDPIPLIDYRKCYVEGMGNNHRCALSRLALDAIYLLVKLDFPLDGSVSITKAVVERTGFRRSLGREIDFEYARSMLQMAMAGDNAISEAVALRYAGKFQAEILSRVQEGYSPDYMHPSLVHGIEAGEKREAVSAKYGKRSVWRDVARTALGIVEAMKETPHNLAVKLAMRRHFVKLIDEANQGILNQHEVFAQPKPETHLMPLYREIAKNEDAMRMFSQFCTGKRIAERELESLCQNFPEWTGVILRDWEGFLKHSLEKARSLQDQTRREVESASQLPLIEKPDDIQAGPLDNAHSPFGDP